MYPQRIVPRILTILALLVAVAVTVPVQAEPKPSGVVYLTRTGDNYHADSCRYLAKSKFATTRGEAEKIGKQVCKVCRP